MNEEKQTAPGGYRGGGTGNVDAGASVSVPIITPPVDFVKKCMQALLTSDDRPQLPADYAGPWADELAAVAGAHRDGGRAAARRAFDALVKMRPGLADLLAGDTATVKRMMTLAELLAIDFPAPRWAVPNLLPCGLTFLAGRPKLGKSWLALQLAHAVATGGIALGQRVDAGPVLYLALEDSWRRIQERAKRQRIPDNAPITFTTAWEPLAEAGLAALQTEMERLCPRLIIIDTFSRVAGRADQLDVGEMTAILSNLQRAALDHDLALLCIDHHRKTSGFEANPIDDILGSTAKGAVCDGAWGLYRTQGQHEATLSVTGREMDQRELALQFDGLTMSWQLLGEAGEVRKGTLQDEVCRAIHELERMGEMPTTTRIAAHTGLQTSNVSKVLADLLARGTVVKAPRQGRQQPYALAPSDLWK